MIDRDIIATSQVIGSVSNNIKSTKLSCIRGLVPLFLLCFLFGCSLPRARHINQIESSVNSFPEKITHVNHREFSANSSSEGETSLKSGRESSDCVSLPGEDDIENMTRDTGTLLENSQDFSKTRDKKLDRDQAFLDSALDDYKASQKFWAEGYLNKATDALDQAYGSILKVKNDYNPEIIQQKEDLRFMISKRVLEIHASRYTAVIGDHKAIPLTMNKYVEREIRSFQGQRRKFFIESYRRSGRYRGEIVKALKKAGMPEELSWLPLIESGFKVRALSRARALGLWQFIPSTGYKFGLNRDMWIDERLDPAKSTAAAISYLNELHHIFGDWSTVLAAYNCGEVTVLRIIRGQKIDYLDNFWDLYEKLPRETASYVPKFLATLHIIKNPKKYGMDLGTPDKPIPYDSVTIDKQVSLKTVANKLRVSFKTLTALNPELRYRVTPDSPYALKVPQGKGKILLAEIADIPEWSPPKKSYLCHRVRRGESLSLLASRYHSSIRGIMQMNRIHRKSLIRVGQRLKIPLAGRRFSRRRIARHLKGLHNGKYLVREGDSLWFIARKFNTTTREICRLNSLSSTYLHVGQLLKITPDKSPVKPRKGAIYHVKAGDSPSYIAKKYKMSLSRLLRINNLDNRSKIYPGQVLVVAE